MLELSRRSFLALGAAAVAAPRLTAAARYEPVWHDAVDWAIEGRAFADRKSPYDRLPARAEGVVRKAVWDLSRNSAGMMLRFSTTSGSLSVRYRLSGERIGMAHMPATGVSGCDLYGDDGKGWRWIDVTRPNKQDVQARLFAGVAVAPRRFQLYLPLYNGIERLELAVDEGCKLEPLPPRANKPILCYGTSILHGASASRPGMAWPAIVGRALDRQMLNFGFSGNGKMEAEVAQFLLELDPAAFVVDCLPNMSPKEVAERTGPLLQQIRAKHAKTPILMIEDRTFANAWFHQQRQRDHEARRAALREAVAAAQAAGMQGVHLLAGADLLGDDGDGTTDGSHPNDLGMMRQATKVIAALQPLLA